MTPYRIPLKAKYRRSGRLLHRPFDPPEGTWVYSAGSFKSRTENQGKAKKGKQGTGPRRRQALGSAPAFPVIAVPKAA